MNFADWCGELGLLGGEPRGLDTVPGVEPPPSTTSEVIDELLSETDQ